VVTEKDKIQKEIDKIVHDWSEEGIRVEKARWGRHHIIKGKTKIELPKTVDATKLTLKEVQLIIEKKTPKKKIKKGSKKN
jgi:DNA topoisomerase-1